MSGGSSLSACPEVDACPCPASPGCLSHASNLRNRSQHSSNPRISSLHPTNPQISSQHQPASQLSIPNYSFYRDFYGGELSAEGFAEALPAAVRLMRGLTTFDRVGSGWDAFDAEAWLRGCCAAVDAFAEFGEGRVGGYAVGDFKVTNYMEKGTTGREVALEAALAELAGTGLAFGGVR